MKDYDNTNSGSIWKNDKKKTDKHPDFTGTMDVEGVEYWMSGWLRAKDANLKAPSMKFKLTKKEPKQENANNGIDESVDFDDDIPF